MNRTPNRVIRYSESFKQQVVREFEEEHRSLLYLQKRYGIKGSATIQHWIKRMGKLELLPIQIRVEKPNEKDRIKELERQIRELKESLADTQVLHLIAESRFEVVCEQQGLDPEQVKKKLKGKHSSK